MSLHRMRKLLRLSVMFIAISGSVGAQTTYTLSGTVTGPDFAAADVTILMYTMDGNPIGSYIDTTDANGFYSITGVDPGIYGVSFRPRTSSHLVPRFIDSVVIQSNVTLNVALEYGNILEGTVTDTLGDPIPDVDLNVYDEFTGVKLFTPGDNTDPDGFYDIVVPSGTFKIIYEAQASERLVPIKLEDVVIAADTTIDVVLESGFFISGVVLGPGGVPVVDADLDAVDSATGVKIHTPGDNTNDQGNYLLLVPAGIYDVNVAPDPNDHLLPGIVYGIPVFNDITLDFNLVAGIMLYGTVTDPVGSAVYDADIDVHYSPSGERLFTPDDNTDSTGFYQVIIPPGTYDIEYKPRVIPPYLGCVLLQAVNITTDTQINVTVPYGLLLSGEVKNASGVGVFGVDIDVVDTLSGISIPLVGDHTDGSGSFATAIAPGIYHVEVEPPQERRLASVLLPGLTFNVDTLITVVLDTGMVVSGTVSDSTGAELPDIKAIATQSSTQERAFTPGNRTDSLGFYQIIISPDEYDLLYKPDTTLGWQDSVMFFNVGVFTDTTIDVVFSGSTPDTIPPTVTVVIPNGGESWAAYTDHTIYWSATDNIGITSIDISYSTTGPGGPYTPISSGEVNDGNYFWSVPPDTTHDARVKVVAYDGNLNSSEDISDVSFTIYLSAPDTIPPTVTVIAPNGGDSLPAYTNRTIHWSATDNIEVTSIDISYSTTGPGGPYTLISSGEANDGHYLWYVPFDTTNDGRVKVVAYDSALNSAEDISDSSFTIYLVTSECVYVPGDANGVGGANGLDVTFMVNYLKGGPDAPPDQCYCPPHGVIYTAADANGSCMFNGIDVTYLVSYLKGGPDAPQGCSDCPPNGL